MQHAGRSNRFKSFEEPLSEYSNEYTDGVEFRFDWEVPEIIRSSYKANKEVWSPKSHVVLLQDSVAPADIMATTCREYLVKSWETLTPLMLNMLDRLTKETLRHLEIASSSVTRPSGSQAALITGLSALPLPTLGILGLPFVVGMPANTGTAALIKNNEEAATEPEPVVKFDVSDIEGTSIKLFDSVAVLHFRSLDDAKKAMGLVEAWDWLCKSVRLARQDGLKLSTSSPEFRARAREGNCSVFPAI
ncbi:hypothetical protein BDW74DRAFT_180867 [Aspergillus multicolor]|uniref:uncharacterized protein n=1 Tax=Aspergillus multicolor TaxID=41759 RepID=UPI003CCD27F0